MIFHLINFSSYKKSHTVPVGNVLFLSSLKTILTFPLHAISAETPEDTSNN